MLYLQKAADLQRASPGASSDSFQQLSPLSSNSDCPEKITKCSLHGWLLNFPLDGLSSNTPPQPGHSPPKNRKSPGRNRPTASQQLRHNPPPNPPMTPSIPTLRPRSQHLRPPARFPTQNSQNSQVFQHWTLQPRMRRHVLSVRAPGPRKTPRVQSNVRRGS